ncbi:hypothetical protein KCTC52924_03888 [Arenibacter antarcticus]|uniref:DUF58 domain-containing protein n=1 Tax=Arenibacter antarcticus TaxID=2040469 RepID=A0ABW5VGS5_9FLAO|nr:DUF58 domain-containing protein [Arenibacter sp. H213]
MKQDYHQLLQPEIINSISGLSLIAKVIVEGHFTGLNQSRRVGQGLQFSQYRAYQPGDDMRLMDWKMLARSGRYYIKQSEIDTHITVKFILDASKSMAHKEKEISKMDHARVLIASLAYLAEQQGDAVGLFAINDQKLHSLYPSGQKQHYKMFLHQLLQIENEGKWPTDSHSFQKIHDSGQKELIFFVTDLHEEGEELTATIKQLKKATNEVVVVHIMGGKEMDFSYNGNILFEDLESGKRVKVNAKMSRNLYLSLLNTRIDTVKNELLSHNIGYQLFRMDEPIGKALQIFIKTRSSIL